MTIKWQHEDPCGDGNTVSLHCIYGYTDCDNLQFYKMLSLEEIGQKVHYKCTNKPLYYLLELHMILFLKIKFH